MKKVICINDKNLPEGAEVVEGKEYLIETEFINDFEQKAYIIHGIINQGTTKWGLRWCGYDSIRFANSDGTYEEIKEFNYALN